MKVKTITVSNLKAVSEMTADFNGCTAIITGGNNKGKTSFLKSLPERIRGNKPDEIVKRGEEEGFAEWQMTDGSKFIWKFDTKTKKGESLSFITKDNIKTSVTREIANRYFPPIFDIDKFLHSTPKQQLKVLQDLTGVDIDEIDNRYKEAYDERTILNRIANEKKARVIEIDDTYPTEKQDETELLEELNSIDTHNSKIDYVEKGIAEKQELISEKEEEVKRLQAKIQELQSEIEKGNEFLSKNKKKNNKEQLQIEIAKVRENNKKYDERLQAERFNSEYQDALAKAQTQDELVKSIEQEKKEALESSNLPKGFEIKDGVLTFENYAISKDQLSSSRIYIASLKLASLQLGEVRTLHFDASYLDKNSLAEIEKWANENDLQLLIERPDFDGGEIEYKLLNQ
ncbi:AAA family ATPase [Riemerella anatipestifer]|uniref:AAA family ATPase n=1 Tax=Riemerella anatipestifer TaxID=34085 RepID=UPI001AD6821A|nr:AAA family ATPase [Riemerella anatipestifer]MBO4234055.1 AAA family ATPase [Riemerella anatipestifer]MDY3344426.1 AAA family ATPase [Riemerella anatipestifer]MDY3357506.1 AAA family ATPase [Riemerella anatipestifer]